MTDRDAPITRDEAQTEKDTAYSPGSDREVRQEQADPELPTDIDADEVRAAPGTGGPDDAGDVDIENAPIHLPGREPAD